MTVERIALRSSDCLEACHACYARKRYLASVSIAVQKIGRGFVYADVDASIFTMPCKIIRIIEIFDDLKGSTIIVCNV